MRKMKLALILVISVTAGTTLGFLPRMLHAGEVKPSNGLSLSDRRIMILNSDVTLPKYALAQNAFLAEVGDHVVDIDLGSKWVSLKKVKKHIKKEDPEIIYCIGTKAFQMAKACARDRKIIFSSAINWQRFDLDNNTSGISNELNPSMQLMMYKYIFPDVKNIGVIYNKAYNAEWIKGAIKAAENMGLILTIKTIKKAKRLSSTLKSLLDEVDALWLIPDPVVLSGKDAVDELFSRCAKRGKPVFAYNEVFIRQGAALAISPDVPTIGRQAASMVKDILANKKTENRVKSLAGSSIALNMKAVEKYGLNLNTDALDSVNNIVK